MTDRSRAELLPGTLDMLVLRILQGGPMHGWGVTERLGRESRRMLQLGQGTLYPALYRLEQQGYVDSEWRTTENGRTACYYILTATGRAHLSAERAKWRRVVSAVELVLRMSEA